MRMLIAVTALILAFGAPIEAHIPDRCTSRLAAASNAIQRHTDATDIATDHAERLAASPQSGAALSRYFNAAQRQSKALHAVMLAYGELIRCIEGR